jgi:hypothetical protein
MQSQLTMRFNAECASMQSRLEEQLLTPWRLNDEISQGVKKKENTICNSVTDKVAP